MRMLLLLAALSLPLAGFAAESEAELRKKTQALQQLQSRIAAIDRELQNSRSQRDALEQGLESAEREVEQLHAVRRSLDDALAQQRRELAAVQAERARVQHHLNAEQARLASQVRAAYRVGHAGRARLALSQSDAADLNRLGRLLAYYDYFHRAQARAIQVVREDAERLRLLEQRRQQETEQLALLQARQVQTSSELADARAQRLQALARLRRRIGGAEAELKQLRLGAAELSGLIARLKEALAGLPAEFSSDQPLAQRRGRLPWPLRGKLLARYGEPKAGGKLKWNGLWIAAAEGAPVRAIADGRVAYVGWMQRFGLIALVEHGGSWFSLYGHNAEVAKAAGHPVRAGELLARAGASGGHEQSGLYFELRQGNKAVNPLEWLARP